MARKKELLKKDYQEILDNIIKDEIGNVTYLKYFPETLKIIFNGGYVPKYLLDCQKGIVRVYIASLGLYLEELVNDPYDLVRKEVAKQGFGLDVLINDSIASVRAQVAKQGYGLDVLVEDKSPTVRLEVAKRGYRLDVLCNDSNLRVNREADKQIAKQKKSED